MCGFVRDTRIAPYKTAQSREKLPRSLAKWSLGEPRSVEQFVSKVRNGAAAYAATDLPPAVGAHWRQYGQILDTQGEAGIEEIFKTWFYREDPTEGLVIHGEQQQALALDPCPR